MVSGDGRLKVLDFGLAKLAENPDPLELTLRIGWQSVKMHVEDREPSLRQERCAVDSTAGTDKNASGNENDLKTRSLLQIVGRFAADFASADFTTLELRGSVSPEPTPRVENAVRTPARRRP